MSTYPSASIPTLGEPACGDPWCLLDICTGTESHGVKKPWYMTQQPIPDPKNDQPPPIRLMKMGEWVLEKYRESDKESQLFQYCPSTQWKKQLCLTEIRAGMCDNCCEIIPEEMVAAFTMHNWASIQQHDRDMAKYGGEACDPITTDPKIEVFR